MVNIVNASKEDLRSRLVRRALVLAVAPVAIVVLVLLAGGMAAQSGWLKLQEQGSRLSVDSRGPLARAGRGVLGRDGYLLEVPSGGNIAVAAWTAVPSGLA